MAERPRENPHLSANRCSRSEPLRSDFARGDCRPQGCLGSSGDATRAYTPPARVARAGSSGSPTRARALLKGARLTPDRGRPPNFLGPGIRTDPEPFLREDLTPHRAGRSGSPSRADSWLRGETHPGQREAPECNSTRAFSRQGALDA